MSKQIDQLSRQAVEDYLKTIYELAEVASPVNTARIAEAREVKQASATNMAQRLAKLGYVHYEKHGGVTLTEPGRHLALEMIRHHRLIELYLTEKLGFGWDEVHEQADLLEHVISEPLEARMAAALNEPAFDPHGSPIPSKAGEIASLNVEPLATVIAGRSATVSCISDDSNSHLLRYLASLGLLPGTVVTVTDIAPFEGPLTIKVDTQQHIIGRKAAAQVYVEAR